MKARIFLVASLVLGVLAMLCSDSATAESIGCRVEINPVNPTSMDEVEIEVIFDFRTWPPYVDDFGSVIQNGSLYSVNVAIHVPKEDEFVLQMVHSANFKYSLGMLDPGHYIFEVYVETIHGYEESWCIKRVEFDVRSSETTVPEFPSNVASLLMLVLTAMSALLLKKSGKV